MKRFLMLALGAGFALPAAAQSPMAPKPKPQIMAPKSGMAPATKAVPKFKTVPKTATIPGPHTHDDAAPPAKKESISDYLWRQSDVAFHDGNYEEAVAIHRAIVAYDPTDVESYSVAAWLLWSLGKGPDAIAFLNQGLKANPKDPEMWDATGQNYDLQKKFAEAKAAYAKAVELAGPKVDQMMRRRLAHASEKAGDLKGSIQTWQALVHDYPTEVVDKNNLARVQAMQTTKNAGVPMASMAGVAGLGLVSMLIVRRRTATDSI